MSFIWVDAVIRNPFTGIAIIAITVKALVDMGIILTVVPRRVADELQLPVIGRRRVVMANGVAELDECIGVVEVTGRKAYTHILVLDYVDAVLIGVATLEILGLEVDSVMGGLKEAKTHLL